MQTETLPSGIAIVEDRGYVDISAELIVQLCTERETPRPFTSIVVVSDALPKGATIHSVGRGDFHDTVRVYLDGVEPRQYRPQLSERTPEPTADVEVNGANRRDKVAKALLGLWYAMGIEWDSRLVVADDRQQRQREYWSQVGKALLGDDAPEGHIYCG